MVNIKFREKKYSYEGSFCCSCDKEFYTRNPEASYIGCLNLCQDCASKLIPEMKEFADKFSLSRENDIATEEYWEIQREIINQKNSFMGDLIDKYMFCDCSVCSRVETCGISSALEFIENTTDIKNVKKELMGFEHYAKCFRPKVPDLYLHVTLVKLASVMNHSYDMVMFHPIITDDGYESGIELKLNNAFIIEFKSYEIYDIKAVGEGNKIADDHCMEANVYGSLHAVSHALCLYNQYKEEKEYT